MEQLFTDSRSALRFAFSYSTQQYALTPMAKLMRGHVGSGKGLVGNDGAGQAGMLRERLDSTLSGLQVAILVARFAPAWLPCDCRRSCCSGRRRNPEWELAIVYLTEDLVSVLAGCVSHRQLRRFLIERYFGSDKDAFGRKVTMEALAEKCGVSRRTVTSHDAKLRAYLRGTRGINGIKGQEDLALYLADDALRGAGFLDADAA